MRRWMTLALLAASSLLAALAVGSARPQAPGARADLCLDGAGRLPAQWSDRRKVVHLAVCEWSKFGYPVVEIRKAPRAEEDSLPAALGLSPALRAAAAPSRPGYEAVTPAVEVQTRFGRTESDRSASAAIETYWAAVRPSYVAGMRETRRAAANRSYDPGWWEPWSAAFTSWVYQTAQVEGFRGSASHVQYLKPVLARRPGQVARIDRYKPLPGDLICAPRADAGGAPTAVSVQAFMEALKSGREFFETHCDVVVRVNRTSVVAIGGNVKNTVAATVTPLRNGRLLRTNARPWAAALSLGEPYDPCARIESAPLRGWEGEGAERRRALRRTGCRDLPF